MIKWKLKENIKIYLYKLELEMNFCVILLKYFILFI